MACDEGGTVVPESLPYRPAAGSVRRERDGRRALVPGLRRRRGRLRSLDCRRATASPRTPTTPPRTPTRPAPTPTRRRTTGARTGLPSATTASTRWRTTTDTSSSSGRSAARRSTTGIAPDQGNYGGGYGFVATADGDAWCTAYAFRPPHARTTRVFGMGYFETSTEYGGLRVTRRHLRACQGTRRCCSATSPSSPPRRRAPRRALGRVLGRRPAPAHLRAAAHRRRSRRTATRSATPRTRASRSRRRSTGRRSGRTWTGRLATPRGRRAIRSARSTTGRPTSCSARSRAA